MTKFTLNTIIDKSSGSLHIQAFHRLSPSHNTIYSSLQQPIQFLVHLAYISDLLLGLCLDLECFSAPWINWMSIHQAVWDLASNTQRILTLRMASASSLLYLCPIYHSGPQDKETARANSVSGIVGYIPKFPVHPWGIYPKYQKVWTQLNMITYNYKTILYPFNQSDNSKISKANTEGYKVVSKIYLLILKNSFFLSNQNLMIKTKEVILIKHKRKISFSYT